MRYKDSHGFGGMLLNSIVNTNDGVVIVWFKKTSFLSQMVVSETLSEGPTASGVTCRGYGFLYPYWKFKKENCKHFFKIFFGRGV